MNLKSKITVVHARYWLASAFRLTAMVLILISGPTIMLAILDLGRTFFRPVLYPGNNDTLIQRFNDFLNGLSPGVTWIVLSPVLFLCARALARTILPNPRHCEKCGYPLAGLDMKAACPECGEKNDR